MQPGTLLLLPGPLDNGGLGEVRDLFLYIQLRQSVRTRFHVFDRLQLPAVQAIDVFDIPQPHIQHVVIIVIRHCGLDPAAAIMTANDDMPDFQMVNGKIQDTEQVDIRMDHQIGDIPVDKDLTGLGARDLVGRHPAVTTPDPEELGRLQV